MSLFSRAFSTFQRKNYSPSETPTKEERIFWSGIGGYGETRFQQVAPALRAGLVISAGMGAMPIKVEGHPEIEGLLNDRANELQTGVELIEQLTLHAVFCGSGRAFIERRGKKIKAIYPMPPEWHAGGWVWNEQLSQYELPVKIHNKGGVDEVVGHFTRKDILEVSNPRWDMLRGLDVTKACQNVLGLTRRLQDRQARLSDSNAPYGILVAKDGTSSEAVKKLKSAWVAQFGQTGIAVADFEAQFTQMMQTASDQQLLETMQFQVEEIARLYGVHPYMLMKTAGSGAQDAIPNIMLFHQTYTMGPWIRRWEKALKFTLTGDVEPNFDESALMRATPSVKAEIYARALGSGGNIPWMTPDEVRAGKNPFDLSARGDDFWGQQAPKGAENGN